jgi:Ca2+-binding EF-hand superfamily protein
MRMTPLPPNQIYFLMYKFDSNRDGKLDIFEFKKMLRSMGGHG